MTGDVVIYNIVSTTPHSWQVVLADDIYGTIGPSIYDKQSN